ncbi:hypothetical protein QN277_026338 [Acacia crassicarpa]|uniref:EamA domain-containing protein n=1 Tax=Acacia crassicarpa TaxID=499986 RepID=A0AAE1J950_9FABA|nr:hypothetical protein QN277_026338 [Acacia crassicarpa]
MESKYKIGLLLIFTVQILGITSDEILQCILTEYNHPFIVTYIQISLLVLYLPLASITAWLQKSAIQCFGWRRTETSSTDQSHEADDDYFDLEQLMISTDGLSQDHRKFTTFGVAKLAFTIAPFWFMAQYLNNAAIARRSVASAIILVSTSSAFTLWIGKFLNKESMNWMNILSVIVSLTGVALTTLLGHTWKAGEDEPTSTSTFNFISLIRNGGHNFLGDILALLSAISEAIFTVLLKRYAGEGEGLDMRVLYGYIGLFTVSSLWWLVWPLVALGMEPKFKLPGVDEMKTIIFSGLVGTFFCDYALGLGVAWTTPLVATIGSSLTIPIAMLEDMLLHKQHYSLLYAFGSLLDF